MMFSWLPLVSVIRKALYKCDDTVCLFSNNANDAEQVEAINKTDFFRQSRLMLEASKDLNNVRGRLSPPSDRLPQPSARPPPPIDRLPMPVDRLPPPSARIPPPLMSRLDTQPASSLSSVYINR
jgi:hypothetical protein